MILVQDEKTRARSVDSPLGIGDLPPAYDAISLRQPSLIRQPSSPALLQDTSRASSSKSFDPAVYSFHANPPQDTQGTSSSPKPFDPAEYSYYGDFKSRVPQMEKPLSSPPGSPPDDTPSPAGESSTGATNPRKSGKCKKKSSSWLSLLTFGCSSSSKRVRQSVISLVNDLVTPSPLPANGGRQSPHEALAAAAETCREHKLSLSSILQETLIAEHTPVYWAVVNYREELLVALLIHARPLSVQTISEIRRACVACSNQPLFQALRVRRRPFHLTDGIQIPSMRAASDNLLLGSLPSDDIRVQQANEGAFIVSFQISVWQKRMRAIGQVNIEFIASGRMWSVTFFSTNPPGQTCGKSKKGAGVWHVMVTLLEASPPTFFDSQLMIDIPSPGSPRAPCRGRMSRSNDMPGSLKQSAIFLPLTAGTRKLSRRSENADPPGALEAPTTKPETWSTKGVNYTNAVVSSLAEGNGAELSYENSRYLLPDGTMRGRLEVRLVKKSESSKDCIIC